MAEATISAQPEIRLPGRIGHWILVVLYANNTASVHQGPPPSPPSGHFDEFSAHGPGDMVRHRLPTIDVDDAASFQQLVDREASELVERIELKLAEDEEEALLSDDVAPAPNAVQACLRLARRFAPHVALAPRLKSGAFTEDDGGISLVFQSLVTDRRVTCRIDPRGTRVSAIRIDEGMRADSPVMSLDNRDAPRELAEWVTKRA